MQYKVGDSPMSPLKIGINGFGRIGRAVARILEADSMHEITRINDVNADINNLAYQYSYDSVLGRLPALEVCDGGLKFARSRAAVSSHKSYEDLQWSDVDVIVEASGIKSHEEEALQSRDSNRTLFTWASEKADKTIVFGVNEDEFDIANHRVVSTSICDVNASAPVLKMLDEHFGISHGSVTTLHPVLSYQNVVDNTPKCQAYPGTTYTHYPLGRSIVNTLIPKPTSLTYACDHVLPNTSTKIMSMSYRLPTTCVTSADMVLRLGTSTSREELVSFLRERVQNLPSGVLKMCDEPLISMDYLKEPYSAVIDERWIQVNEVDPLLIRIVLWYDNEWGYSNRVVDLVNHIAKNLK
jgi:glyceraldehyde 3-phosphate dehydrogenase